MPLHPSSRSSWHLAATCRLPSEALQMIINNLQLAPSPQTCCNRETLDSSHLNSAAQRPAPVALERLGRRWPAGSHTSCLPKPPRQPGSLPPRGHNGHLAFPSPPWPSGVREVSRDTLPIPPGPSALHYKPLETSRGLFSCCWLSMIS